MAWEFAIALFFGGLAAGIINTLAGNGSAITLSLLIFSGLPADIANGTNRVGAMLQTVTAVGSLRKSKRTKMLIQQSMWFLIPSIVGTIGGSLLATVIDPSVLETVIGIFMLLLLITLLYKPSKWMRATDLDKEKKTWRNALWIFGIAVYGGFIQMGIGIMLLSVLVLIARYSLRDANIVKLVLAMIFVVPSFFVFALAGELEWVSGTVLAIGQAIGAWIGARYILFMPKANQIVRWVLIFVLSISSVKLLGIFDYLLQLLS